MNTVSAGSEAVYGETALMHGMNVSFLCMAAGAAVLLFDGGLYGEKNSIDTDPLTFQQDLCYNLRRKEERRHGYIQGR